MEKQNKTEQNETKFLQGTQVDKTLHNPTTITTTTTLDLSPLQLLSKKDIVVILACLLHTAQGSHLPCLCPKTIEKCLKSPCSLA
jgi:hypothetical protein